MALGPIELSFKLHYLEVALLEVDQETALIVKGLGDLDRCRNGVLGHCVCGHRFVPD